MRNNLKKAIMTVEVQKRSRRWRLWVALAAIAVVLAAIFVPPMISINRYKKQIAELVSQSLGRQVHLNGVELRLLPWPSFVLSNLVVDEDPAYGAEPLLSAETVTTDVRLLALWRGRLEISQISVDNASLNLVRMPGGHWNLDPLFRTAAAKAGAAANRESRDRRAPPLPYLEATESRINFKNGVEKLPFSIVNADLSFSEDSPGDWHIRLRGQPARTDVSLFQEDTGVVRLDATLHSATALRNMPLRVDLEWSQAQLGQLSRLLIGSDPGWRGDLTADLHLDGTPETAHIAARVQAEGVHRAEFAPAEPLDFDANCSFVYHYSSRAVQNLACDSPLGTGRVRIAGDLPGSGGHPNLSVALDHMPAAAALAFMRTVRSGIDPGLTASGSISGKLSYSGKAVSSAPAPRPHRSHTRAAAHSDAAPPLTGKLTVSDFQLGGGPLSKPIRARQIELEPEASAPGEPLAIAGEVEVAAGAPDPLILTPHLTFHGYDLAVRGEAALANTRQLAQLAGIEKLTELGDLTGGPVSIAVDASGPWLPPEPTELIPPQPAEPGETPDPSSSDPPPQAQNSADEFSGTISLHDATWKPDFLARSVAISQATLHLLGDQADWDPVHFSYGPVKATASIMAPAVCSADLGCPAHFTLQLGDVDAAELQSAILGARPQTSLLDNLIDRLHLSSSPAWPPLVGSVKVASLKVGPVRLQDALVTLKIDSTGATLSSVDAGILGGEVHASGSFKRPETDQGRPAYVFDAKFSRLNSAAVGKLLDMSWSGGPFDAAGKVEMAGLSARGLATSAKGTLHFTWRDGSVGGMQKSTDTPAEVPPQLQRFALLTGDAQIGNATITVQNCQAESRGRRRDVDAKVTLAEPLKIAFPAQEQKVAARR
jgi:hypothetical protein